DEDGALDESVAREVKQCDIRNGVSKIINWTKDTDLEDCANCYIPVLKVEGSDTGIAHSFELTEDAFAEGEDKRLVNYKSYYYLAIAYAHNNFAPFHQFKEDST